MKKLKILAIDQGEHLGGAERFFAELLTRLPASYEVHLVTDHNSEYHKLYKNSAVTFHKTQLPPLKRMSLRSLMAWHGTSKRVGKLIDAIKPAVIISNTARTHLIISKQASKKKIPLVWMMHDATFPKRLFQWFKKYPTKTIACSKYIADIYGAKHVLYPFGVNEGELKEYHSVKKQKIIGMVGNFIPWKGQDIFIHAAHELHRRHPDYRFVIIGQPYKGNSESESFHNKCVKLIDTLKMRSMINIKTRVVDVQSEMAAWKVLVHCSTDPEPLGRVILEGMSAGCAVIASNQGGPLEILHGGLLGMPVKPKSDSLVEAISQLIEHPELRKHLNENSNEWLLKNCTWKKVMDKFVKMVD